ncbi:interleukin 17a/f3 [Eleginops maclovinus]
MLLVLRALLLLGLASMLHAARKGQSVSLNLGNGARRKANTVRLVMDPSVQTQHISASSATIANMSLSPWKYIDSCVPSRLPRRISHAQCLTSGCMSLEGGGEDAALEAKPIYYQILVLHKIPRQVHNRKGGRKTKQFDLRLETEVIPVGCTCVRPSVIPQKPQEGSLGIF